MAARPGGEGDGAPPRPLPAPASDFVLQPAGLAYLNVATLGPVPRRVLEATHRDVLALQANPHVNYFLAAPGSVCERMDQVRAQVAGLLGCTQQEVFLFSCTTQALTAVAEGLLASGFLRAGDRVVTTDQEHAGALAGWRHLEATAGLRLSAVALGVPETRGEAAVVEAFRAELAREPRAKNVDRLLHLVLIDVDNERLIKHPTCWIVTRTQRGHNRARRDDAEPAEPAVSSAPESLKETVTETDEGILQALAALRGRST
eukprot:jgi/Tetstr1/453062/TSEL_040098.t1